MLYYIPLLNYNFFLTIFWQILGMRAILSLYLRHLLIEDGMEADQVN